jgi:hypothetical protein
MQLNIFENFLCVNFGLHLICAEHNSGMSGPPPFFLEVPGSDKDPEISCYLVPLGKCDKTLNWALPACFYNLSNSLFCNIPTD